MSVRGVSTIIMFSNSKMSEIDLRGGGGSVFFKLKMSDLSAEGWSGQIGNFSQNLAQIVIHGSTKVASQPLKWRPTATPTLVPK